MKTPTKPVVVQAKTNQATYRSFIDLSGSIKANEDGTVAVPTEIQLLDCGEWNTMNHGKFKINEGTLDDMVKNFNDGVRKGVPIDEEHNTTGGADGWVENVFRQGTKLMASVDWNNRGKTALADKVFRFFSPEFSFDYADPETGKNYKNVLLGGALTNRPLFKNLKPIMASDGTKTNILYLNEENPMDIETLRAKPQEELTDEEKAFMAEHGTEAPKAEEPKPVAPVAEEPAPAAEPVAEPEAPAEPTAPIEASEGSVVIKASELDALKAAAVKANEYFEKIRQTEASEKVQGWLFDEKGGKFPPTAKDALAGFVLGLNEAQARDFDKVVELIPDRKMFGEVGIDEKPTTGAEVKTQNGLQGSAAKQLEEKAVLMANENPGMQYGHALVKVRTAHPDLANQADEDNQPVKVTGYR